MALGYMKWKERKLFGKRLCTSQGLFSFNEGGTGLILVIILWGLGMTNGFYLTFWTKKFAPRISLFHNPNRGGFWGEISCKP